MKKNYFLLLAFALIAMPVFADDDDEEEEEDEDEYIERDYAYRHTLEVQAGCAWNLRSYSNAPSMAVGFMGDHHTGGSFFVRYTEFFSDHWGAFWSAESSPMRCNGTSELYKYGPNKYDYQRNYEWPNDGTGGCFSFGAERFGTTYAQLLTGATYRYDFGNHWSLRGRLGIGYRRMNPGDGFEYARWDQACTNWNTDIYYLQHPDDFEVVNICAVNRHHKTISCAYSWAYSPSVQMCFMPRHHLFISVEAQWTGTAHSIYEQINVYDVHQEISPCEEDSYYYNTFVDEDGTRKRSEFEKTLKSTSYYKVKMGNFLALRLGIGWNIGRNRNERR